MGSLINIAVVSVLAFLQSFIPQPTYNEGVIGQPITFNPLKVGTNQIDRDISALIFRGLVRYDSSGAIVGDLTENWSLSPDNKEYTFNLKRDIYWQDRVKFTADDVLYTVSKYPQLREIPTDKLDNYTIRFRLKEPLAPFLDILTVGVIPAHLADRLDDLYPVGTGDYRVIRIKKTKRIDEVVLQGRNRKIIFLFYERKKDLITASTLGEIDGFLIEGPLESNNQPNFNYFVLPIKTRFFGIFFNLNNEGLKDKELRKALAAVTPKERIAAEVFGGSVTVINGPEDGNITESQNYKKYTPADLPEKKFSGNFTLSVPNKPEHLKTAVIIKEEWEKIGIQLQIIPVDLDKITSDVIGPKNFEILLLGQEVSRDPDRYTLWHSTQKDLPGLNFPGLKQVRIDRSLEEGRKTMNADERLIFYQHFQEVFAEEVPAIYLYQPTATYVLKKKITPTGDFSNLFYLSDRFNNFSNWILD